MKKLTSDLKNVKKKPRNKSKASKKKEVTHERAETNEIPNSIQKRQLIKQRAVLLWRSIKLTSIYQDWQGQKEKTHIFMFWKK